MKSIFFIISFFLISITVEAQWTLKTNGLPQGLETPFCIGTYGCNIALISAATSFVQRPLYYTSDTGNNWMEINWPGDTMQVETVMDLSLTGPDTFYIGTDIGRIFKTTDKGNTWTLQFSNDTLTNFINYIEFFGSKNGIAMGDAASGNIPVFLKTTNGGVDWMSVNNQPIGPYSGDTWRRVDFVNPDTGYFYESGIEPRKLYKTTDGGTTWNLVNFTSGIWMMKFYDGNHGIVTSDHLYKTTDGGDTWTQLDSSFNVLDLEFLNENEIFAVDSRILYSSDGGETWEGNPLGVTGFDMALVDSTCGWILAWYGKVFYNNNLNILTSASEKSAFSKPLEYSLLQNYPNPFNPTTTISWQSPVGSWQTLKVYDVLGREVATLVNEYKPAGKYEVEFNAHNLPSGIYIYRIETNGYSASRKMILLK